MYLKEIEYIVTIADTGSLTKAAEKLYITPSALTQQLLRLENELGTSLFLRTRSNWIPTAAGEVYIRTGREMLTMKQQAMKQMQDIASLKRGSIVIGFPPDRATEMITDIYPIFHRDYPNYAIKVLELNVRAQQKLVTNGEIDISFQVVTRKQQTSDVYIPLADEEILLAVPSIHPAGQYARSSDLSRFPELDLKHLAHEPFAQIYKISTLRDMTDDIFREAGISPEFIFETASNHTIANVVAAGLCCGLVPDTVIDAAPPGVTFYSLPTHPKRQITASYRRGIYLSQAEKHLLVLAKEIFGDGNY